ncbi:unnamed protein product [Mytilus edulis]|uniref:C2H2-type domain-containing protein n=1 Tax=Mytilus edulis TaxID=6550 RepID=A0A8S3SU39_MYTED|nr:unnamed protein product [Mytilus edulis]
MDFEKYELISDTESVEDDQQQTCSTSYDLAAKGVPTINQPKGNETASETEGQYLEQLSKKLIRSLPLVMGEKTSRILFKCKICKFSSKDETKLIKHENIHNTEYKFSCTTCERRFRLQSNCNRHIRQNHKVSTEQEYSQYAGHSNLIEEKDERRIKNGHVSPPEVRSTLNGDTKYKQDNVRQENTYQSWNFKSKHKLDGSNLDDKVKVKKHRLSLDKDKKILTLSKKLYSENCSREDLLAKTSSIKIDSDNNNINERSFKNVESNDNETDVDLPTLKRPRRRFLNSSEHRLTHTHYSIIPDSGENTEFEDKECVENTSIKDLSDSFLVPFKEPAKTYPITLPPTQPIVIDRISEDKFKDKISKADTKKEQLQALGIKKKRCNATNNDNVNYQSSSETLQNKMVQRVTIKFWDRNNLIRKVLDWNPVWFNEFEKWRRRRSLDASGVGNHKPRISLTHQECKTTPGDILKNVGHHLSAYENKEDYFKTVLPHLLLETWESFVHSLRDVLSIYDGLATSFETQLIRHLLKPGNIDIFKSISMERNERASDVLVNKNDFNALQRRAILNASDMILDRNMKNCVCLIRGPFGTGKTDILIGIIKTVFQKSGGKCCIALCAPSEVAVGHHMKMLIREREKIQLSKKEYHKRKTATPSVLNELQQLKEKIAIIKATDHGTDEKMSEEKLERDVLSQGKVICGTFKSFGEQLYLNVLSSVKNNCRKSTFTCMIMDEAQQASELETLLPLQYGPSKLIMAGDLEQLAPKIKSKPSRDHSFGQSLFERLCDHFRFHGDKNTVLVLKTQYRSHPEIAKFPSEMFYGQHIDTHRYLKERSKMFNLKPYIVFNIESATKYQTNQKDFGIITSSDEISKIKEGLANSKLENMEVDTVTGFQGRSKEIIILSCSGSNTDKNGFLTCHKELNVALTRARSALYVVGNLDALSEENEAFQKLVADAKDRDILREVKEDYVSNDIFVHAYLQNPD